MPIPAPPPQTPIPDTTGDYARAQSWALVNARNVDAINWATWAANAIGSGITDINKLLGSDTVEADLAALVAELGTLVNSAPGTINGAGAGFSDALLTSLKARLSADIATYSTGLGTAEAAMFARETARVSAATAKAYDEATTFFSSRGWDMPPGALDDAISEASAESAQNLTDSSGKILEESARLAVQYNLGIVNASTQLIDALARVYESEEARKFEASKATVMLAVENYKSYLGLTGAKADIAIKKAQLILDNKARQLALEVNTLLESSKAYQQIVASSLNGISASASFGWGASASTSYLGT
jgi:hypothetical protein